MSQFQPRNSASHAIEALNELLPDLEHRKPEDLDILELRAQEALHWLKVSAKFTGPVNGQFLERIDMLAEGVDFPKLPFPAICLEYDYAVDPEAFPASVELAAKEDQPDRVCVLAFYPDSNFPTGQLANKYYGSMDDGEFLVWPILGFSAGRALHGVHQGRQRWIPGMDPVVVTTQAKSEWSVEVRNEHMHKRILIHTLPTAESLQARINANVVTGRPAPSQDELRREIATDTAWEALAIMELCNVLQCSNVTTELYPAPAKLNQKRAASGKPPFFSYHILNLAESASAPAAPGTGHHASPRQHYRRGHIRRLSEGRKTWVRPMVVGNPERGQVIKDYDARPRGAKL